mmetsp:Transcript_7510/g.16180  ORF Transcript_7510/g.16180 Transcript_7510/m.16180 type:complete len:91 (+) Transcript_7510:514-786(+)
MAPVISFAVAIASDRNQKATNKAHLGWEGDGLDLYPLVPFVSCCILLVFAGWHVHHEMFYTRRGVVAIIIIPHHGKKFDEENARGLPSFS